MILIEEVNPEHLQISLDIVIVTDDVIINEAINAKDNAKEIIKNVTNIITNFGYEQLEPPYISNSGSMYFTFCDKDSYDLDEVELIIGMRVSDHNLSKWNDKETEQDTKNRQLNHLKNQTKDYYILNKHLTDKDTIPIEYIYVKYENEWYSNIEEVYAKIRQKLRDFQNKHK